MQAPDRLGKYEIRRELGRGAMGVVYEGYDPLIERAVAIKVLRLDEADPDLAAELRMRFRREAQAAGRLGHPGIIAVHEYGEDAAAGSAFIAMELVRGRDLKTLFAAGTRFTHEQTGRLMASLLAALQHAHERGVVHRDVKPGNIMLLESGAAKIADFGIAKLDTSELTQLGSVLGTVSHMAPEQLTGDAVDGRSDLYACGVMLYQLLTGERPFTGTPATLMHKVLHEHPPPPSQVVPGLSPALDRVVRTAMAKQPDERYPNATAFAAALDDALDASRAAAVEPAAAVDARSSSDADATVVFAAGTQPRRGRRTLVATAVGVTAAFAVALLAFRLLEPRTAVESRTRASDPIGASPVPVVASTTAVAEALTAPVPAPGAASAAGAHAATDRIAATGPTAATTAASIAAASAASRPSIGATASAVTRPSETASRPSPRAAPTVPVARATATASTAQAASPAAGPPIARAAVPSVPAAPSADRSPLPAPRIGAPPDSKTALLPDSRTAPLPAPAPPIVAVAPKSAPKAADAPPLAPTASEGKAGTREIKPGRPGPPSSGPAGDAARVDARVEARLAPTDGARPAARAAPPVTAAASSASTAVRSESADCIEEARRGNARCQVVIGNLYRHGSGLLRDPVEAARWYRKAAEQGSDSGQYELGLLYEHGLGVAIDPVAAVSWYRKAATQGHARAQNRLGSAYENGSFGPRNPVLAADWYRKAADQNLPIGLYNLGRLYLAGRGVFKDVAKGQALIQAAADQGEPNSMVMLAGMYSRGDGKPRDREQAARLYREALSRPGLNGEGRSTAQRALASAR